MKYCPKCSAKQEDWVLVCDCGHDFEKTTGAKESPQNDCKNTLKGKYQALWTISYYFKLLAWINLGGAILVIIFLLEKASFTLAVAAAVWGGTAFVVSSAAAELIRLGIDIEESLRKMIFLQEKKDNKK